MCMHLDCGWILTYPKRTLASAGKTTSGCEGIVIKTVLSMSRQAISKVGQVYLYSKLYVEFMYKCCPNKSIAEISKRN